MNSIPSSLLLAASAQANILSMSSSVSLAPGQSFFLFPKPDTELEAIKITTKEGGNVSTDYHTPLKGISLPGSGR